MRASSRARRWLAALAVGLGALATGCAGLIQGDPSKLVLPSGQVPSGFHLLSGATYTNADVAQAFGIPESQVSGAMGRLTGYRVTYIRDVTAGGLTAGPIRIDSVVSIYQGAVPAGRALTYEINANKQRITGLQALSLGSVGQSSASFAYTQTATETATGSATASASPGAVAGQGQVTLRFVDVYWRERNALAAVSVAGVQGAFPDSLAMELARRQDAILRKAP
jgi:hypothetical protein